MRLFRIARNYHSSILLKQMTLFGNPGPARWSSNKSANSGKSDSGEDAQIGRYKRKIRILEEQICALREENELQIRRN